LKNPASAWGGKKYQAIFMDTNTLNTLVQCTQQINFQFDMLLGVVFTLVVLFGFSVGMSQRMR